MESVALTAAQRAALDGLAADLGRVFGVRLHSLVAYGIENPAADGLHSLALLDRLTFDDLAACVPQVTGWRKRGLAVPLLLEREEFRRTLDVFPLEYGAIIRDHVVVAGEPPFAGHMVPDEETRQACEFQAKSQLIHLREGYLETHGDSRAVVQLVAGSAASFAALLANIARLNGDATGDVAAATERHIGIPADVVRDVMSAAASQSTIAEPTALLKRYIDALDRIWEYVDTWRR